MLKGGASNDVLIDDAGADKFVFNTTLGAANIDSSSDYSVADDTIYPENGGGYAVSVAGLLAAGANLI